MLNNEKLSVCFIYEIFERRCVVEFDKFKSETSEGVEENLPKTIVFSFKSQIRQ